MADIIQQMTNYRIKQIEFAEAEYYEQLTKVLDKIEDDITSLANKSLPTTDGKLIELRAAIAIRPQIKAILEREYLAWSDTVVRTGFNKQAKRVEKAFKRIGRIPKEFQELTKGDLALMKETPIHIGIDFGLTPSAVFAQRIGMGIWHILKEFFEVQGVEYRIVNSLEGSILSKITNLVYVLDYSTIYAAILKNMNPSPVKSIDFIKKRL